ncbi:hypothetical protein D5086_011638 [Populus alba]|uniref:Uncharacterized protein n=1 Tax=Populus alba TaxID=43335 RepID=A0ACC4CE95_POPAL
MCGSGTHPECDVLESRFCTAHFFSLMQSFRSQKHSMHWNICEVPSDLGCRNAFEFGTLAVPLAGSLIWPLIYACLKGFAASLACLLEDKRFLPKERGEEDEKSDLTEEDKQPLSSQSLCYLSDGGKTHGTIIRIQLPLRRHREHAAPVNGAGLCSSLGTADSVPQKNKIVETSLRSYDKETRTAESLYQDLIANLEESFQFELNNLVDQEWLFGTTKQDRHGYKRLKVCHDVSCHADSTTRLRAQYLPEADVYGLPYTIPF